VGHLVWPEGLLRAVPVAGLMVLAVFFGRTLRRGETPLIERIARVGTPDLSLALRRYTRRLTALWSGWFLVAAFVSAFGGLSFGATGGLVWAGTIVLFAGEHWLRRRVLFPTEVFPGIVQQVRDTWHVWRPRA